MASKVVAIHQPNFFPWLGYFAKIARADRFVVLDNVQYPKKGGSWSNRVRLLVNREPAWVTMPIVRSYHGMRLIRDMEIDSATPWRDKLLLTIAQNYRRAPLFASAFPLIEELVHNPSTALLDYNLAAIRALMTALGLDTSRLVLGSTLAVEGNATDLLIAIVKAVGGTAYLAGGGAAGYQEDHKFAEAGIELIYQDFQHPVYPQQSAREFVPGLSILDALLNCPVEQVRSLLVPAGVRP